VLTTVSAEYQARLRERKAVHDRLDTADERLSHARLATFAVTVVIAILAWRAGLGVWWLALPAAGFVWLLRAHGRVLRARAAASRAIAFYHRGLERLQDRWIGTGEPGERFRDERHLYANDLDLFGPASLFELLSLARTDGGEVKLASWLASPAGPDEIRSRQEAIQDLGPALDFREALALAGADVRARVDTGRLLAWAESPLPALHAARASTWLFTAAVPALILFIAATGMWWPLAAVVLLEAFVFRRLRGPMYAVLGRSEEERADFVADALTHRARDLDVLAGLLACMESGRFGAERLRRLQGSLAAHDAPPSRGIRRLHRLAEVHDSTANSGLLPLGLFLLGYLELALSAAAVLQLVRPHVTLAVARWRQRHGARVRIWLDAVSEFEAIASFSAYHYEHPEDPFPMIVASDHGRPEALFDGTGLGHPLLPASDMVRNDVHLGGGAQLVVVSGSNMSGKSTLLRTVGINAVLALAGAPVRARSLRLSPLALGATLRIQDSLLEGRSRFYAEITRVRELASLADGPTPLLFLLDELFHGTNSHDRRIGAAGVLRSLLDKGAIGLITTHDLALTSVAAELAPRAANVHFQDTFEEGEIVFDYLMKTGPVTRSNALALMRAVGLDVPSG
jgi:hypothetical protein